MFFIGTVLQMWDAIAKADKAGEFVSRNSEDEFKRLFRFFTLLDRREHAVARDAQTVYLRTAQGWFFLALGAFGGLLLAIGFALS